MMKPYSFLKILAIFITLPFIFFSCEADDINGKKPDGTASYRQTLFMYMPWSGESIYNYFLKNISSFETAIENNGGLDGNALMVFISENSSTSHLIRITYGKGGCVRDTIQEYRFNSCDFTTAKGIASIIGDAAKQAPAETYAMAIGSHGMGWIPAGTEVSTRMSKSMSLHPGVHLTRFFGHWSDRNYQTDIQTLADGIEAAGIKMEYILFDDCYMSNIETAYDLRNVTDFLIASTCEIMIEGMPYAKIGIDLLNNDYKSVCEGFYEFYSNFGRPCGTIGVTDCNEVEGMADIMRQINRQYPSGVENANDVQDLDGYTPTIFFDFGDYVSHLCQDESLLAMFNEQLARLVPYKANTQTYYSSLTNKETTISTFSGLTISDPTRNTSVANDVKKTNWYYATH